MTQQLAPILVAPVDERVGLPMGPPAANSGALHVIVHVDVIPDGKDMAAGWLAEVARAARAMPGSIGFEVATQDGRPNHFQIHQTWSGRAAYDAFVASEASKTFRANVMAVKGAIYDDRLFTPG
jgi:quinol monooxygenase YgiN